jgi:hypothetical protein
MGFEASNVPYLACSTIKTLELTASNRPPFAELDGLHYDVSRRMRSVGAQHGITLRVAVLTSVTLSPLATFSQVQRLDQPSRVAPPSCDINLMTVGNVSGSQSYIRLRYEVEALSTAQESLAGMDAALKDLNGSTSPTMALAGMITGMNQAHDSLACAAYLMGQYRPAEEDDKNIRAILISVFNREANSVADTMAHSKEQILRPASQQSNAVKLRDAERISIRTALQHQAATDLLEATTFSLLRAVDISDSHARTAEYLTVSCDERADLLTKSAPLADANKSADKSAYTTPATFIQKVLNEHKCR